ncbi:MAG: endonuclease [Omnitrophica WOR_2 bacterium RIFCSPHIGHO2_02_FULL_50_17]|nr:MAG: endonuclease [Omnitrophica WOR_2 bacterium RIFCSPHIGHO2_02_FULL_50_17]
MRKTKAAQGILEEIYGRLFKEFGPQHWWPGESPFEVMVGAILTQNTNWGNVERAIRNLKAYKMLSPRALHEISHARLAPLIRPAGYFNVKARRLKNFINFLFEEYQGSLKKMAEEPWPRLRHKLLGVNGVGPETADSILLYAFEKPVFVVDAYTRRILYRHNLAGKDAGYHHIQKLFMTHLDHDVRIFNEYHALIVRLGKDYCRPRPLCERCVLNDVCYSLVSKCNHCHRALKNPAKRRSARELSCKDCS